MGGFCSDTEGNFPRVPPSSVLCCLALSAEEERRRLSRVVVFCAPGAIDVRGVTKGLRSQNARIGQDGGQAQGIHAGAGGQRGMCLDARTPLQGCGQEVAIEGVLYLCGGRLGRESATGPCATCPRSQLLAPAVGQSARHHRQVRPAGGTLQPKWGWCHM